MPSGVYLKTEEHKKNLSISLKGKVPWNKGLKGKENPLTGRKKTKEHKENLSIATKKCWTDPQYRHNHIEAMKDIYSTLEYRKKISNRLVNAHLDPEKYKIILLEKPLTCYYCEELIIVKGVTKNGLVFHSLDGNHDNWDSANKVPTHRKCHPKLHSTTQLWKTRRRETI